MLWWSILLASINTLEIDLLGVVCGSKQKTEIVSRLVMGIY